MPFSFYILFYSSNFNIYFVISLFRVFELRDWKESGNLFLFIAYKIDRMHFILFLEGLIRQYFPKGTNFRNITNKDLVFAVKKLNHMQGCRATKHFLRQYRSKSVSGKTRFCFAKDLHALLRLGADSESFFISKRYCRNINLNEKITYRVLNLF